MLTAQRALTVHQEASGYIQTCTRCDHIRNPCIAVVVTMPQLSITTVYPLERLLTALNLMLDV
jgi:hypothetical protein